MIRRACVPVAATLGREEGSKGFSDGLPTSIAAESLLELLLEERVDLDRLKEDEEEEADSESAPAAALTSIPEITVAHVHAADDADTVAGVVETTDAVDTTGDVETTDIAATVDTTFDAAADETVAAVVEEVMQRVEGLGGEDLVESSLSSL